MSEEGVNDLPETLQVDGTYIITVEPYTFVYGKIGKEYYIIDTHAVPAYVGGINDALLMVLVNASSCLFWIL